MSYTCTLILKRWWVMTTSKFGIDAVHIKKVFCVQTLCIYQYAYLKNVWLWHSFTLTCDKWHTTDLDLIWQGDSLQVGHLQCHLGFIQDVLWEHTLHTLNFWEGAVYTLLVWMSFGSFSLPRWEPVCIWCCEYARFCVEVFYAAYINFHSFIHPSLLIWRQRESHGFHGNLKVCIQMQKITYICTLKIL